MKKSVFNPQKFNTKKIYNIKNHSLNLFQSYCDRFYVIGYSENCYFAFLMHFEIYTSDFLQGRNQDVIREPLLIHILVTSLLFV